MPNMFCCYVIEFYIYCFEPHSVLCAGLGECFNLLPLMLLHDRVVFGQLQS